MSLLLSCTTVPHSAHSLSTNALQKPNNPEELTVIIPVMIGVSFYDTEPAFDESRSMVNDLNLRSYYGEGGLSFSNPLSEDGPAALSGGLSLFSYLGRSIGPEEAEIFGLNRQQEYRGTGGRLNLSIDLNYENRSNKVCWRVFNIQGNYAVETGSYSNYRQIAIDSSNIGFNLLENIDRVTPAGSAYLGMHYYSEVLIDYDDYYLSFGLGFINHFKQDEIGIWENYLLSGNAHFGFGVNNFYARINFGNNNSIFGNLAGTLNANMNVGYRWFL